MPRPARASLALGAALALAGCFSSDLPPDGGVPVPPTGVSLHDASGAVDAPTPAARALLTALADVRVAWLDVDGREAREPTVAVDSEGRLFYATRDYSGGATPVVSGPQTPVLRSDDGGATWREVSPRLPTGDREPPTSQDPMVWVDPWTDRLFQIELYSAPSTPPLCSWLVWSDDGGESWSRNPKACDLVPADHQTIGAGPARLAVTPTVGYENVVYVCVNQNWNSHCGRSLDGGATVGTFHLVYPGVTPDGCFAGGLHGHVLVAPDGTVYLPREYCGRPYVAVSEDDGLTWTLRDVTEATTRLGAGPHDPNMAFDDAGNVYYLWIGDDALAYLAWSADGGRTWSAPARVSAPSVTAASLPSLAAGADGRVVASYVGTTSTRSPPTDEDWTRVAWDAYVAVAHDATAASPTFATLRANTDGDPVYRGDCTQYRCGLLREFLDTSLARDGAAYSAFVDACLEACDTTAGDYGEGNGSLARLARVEGARLRG